MIQETVSLQPEDVGLRMIPRLAGAKGVASIWLSHQKTLEQALEAGLTGPLILLEDDVKIHREFWDLDITQFLPPPGFVLTFLSPRYKLMRRPEGDTRKFVPAPFGTQMVDISALVKDYSITGAHFLIFRDPETVRKTIQLLRSCTEIFDVDKFNLTKLACCGCHVSSVTTAPLGSDHNY